jgi:heptaprenyl diphosphate synthase
MSPRSFVAPNEVALAQQVLFWTKEYLMKENDQVHRPYSSQTVCPFVESSINSNCFYMVFHNEFNGQDESAIVEQILEYIQLFKMSPPLEENLRLRKVLLVVFPKIETANLKVLDVCHRIIKPKMVEEGLMVGQFHPVCDERSIHNRQWRTVSQSPIPLVAMRHMTVHDIMFLESDEQWFKAYDVKFGHRFRDQGRSLSRHQKHLIEFYERARAKHCLSPIARSNIE